jgi:hypothetical protein
MRVQNIDVRTTLLRFVVLTTALAACSTVSTQEPVQLIYSDDAADPWNRLFSIMFTRSVVHRKTSEFGDAGPFTKLGENDFRLFPVSTRTFERFEDGDRAVVPFYPSLDYLYQSPQSPRAAPRPPFNDRRLESFSQALQEALADSRPRTPVARVLMQSDLWAVFDRLSPGDPRIERLARIIAKLALSRAEIAALPDQYALARRSLDFPDLFSPGSAWHEIAWFDHRLHDKDVGFRQATRVFLRADGGVADPRTLFDELRYIAAFMNPLPERSFQRGVQALEKVSDAALAMQLLTIDTGGDIVPTPLFQTVQIRSFPAGPDGRKTTVAMEHELSRARARTLERTGGMRTFRGTDPAYVPAAGNDYGFASQQFGTVREPILGTLDTRCAACHGRGSHLFTFSVHAKEMAPVRVLPQPNTDRARYVVEQKKTREDYKRLRALVDRGR